MSNFPPFPAFYIFTFGIFTSLHFQLFQHLTFQDFQEGGSQGGNNTFICLCTRQDARKKLRGQIGKPRNAQLPKLQFARNGGDQRQRPDTVVNVYITELFCRTSRFKMKNVRKTRNSFEQGCISSHESSNFCTAANPFFSSAFFSNLDLNLLRNWWLTILFPPPPHVSTPLVTGKKQESKVLHQVFDVEPCICPSLSAKSKMALQRICSADSAGYYLGLSSIC